MKEINNKTFLDDSEITNGQNKRDSPANNGDVKTKPEPKTRPPAEKQKGPQNRTSQSNN